MRWPLSKSSDAWFNSVLIQAKHGKTVLVKQNDFF
jgi:hypothetical protein